MTKVYHKAANTGKKTATPRNMWTTGICASGTNASTDTHTTSRAAFARTATSQAAASAAGIDRAPEVFDDNTIAPVEAKGGISIVSMCMFADSDKATIWRGPMVSQMIQHFIHHVRWGKLDYLLVDFPPGTGDIQLTLTQNCPMAGAVVVTTPQEVALADCRKGLAMFDSVGVPVVGVVENMSYFICDQCGKHHNIFREGGGERIAKSWGVPLIAKVPLEPAVAGCGDEGTPAVLRYPNSESAKAFMQAADATVRTLSMFASEGDGVLKNFNFEFEQLPVEDA